MGEVGKRSLGRRLVALPGGLRALAGVRALRGSWPIVVGTLVLAWLSVRAILEKTGGVAAVPLDDAYIHFQYARGFAEGKPLVYSPGSGAVGGATSLLWPLLLAPGYLLGLREHTIVWAAWFFGFFALGLLAYEAERAARRLTTPVGAAGAALLVLAFGANTWFAASGMEVVPLAWLMLRAVRRAAEWCEGETDGAVRTRRLVELCVLGLLLPLMRPEGALASVLVAVGIVWVPRGRTRLVAIVPLLGIGLPALLNYLLTHDFASTTARSKWLPLSPYASFGSLRAAFEGYLLTLVTTLLNGEVWSALFLPKGSAPVALASLFALPVVGLRSRAKQRGFLLFALGLGILIPGTYDCPLCNRLRYLWPFFPAWFVGTAALCGFVVEEFGRRRTNMAGFGYLAVGTLAGALMGYLPMAIDDLAASAAAIYKQQVSLGLWARTRLPETARIGVNDTGAITYFSGRQTFDVVGLTTASEARYWTAGPGSRFEHYERLGVKQLPTHFIVYPEWFAIDDLLGRELTERDVPGASILGGQRMVAYVADYSLLGSGESPRLAEVRDWKLIDRLDVADLESERAHNYQLLGGNQRQNYVARSGESLDGARAERQRDDFDLLVAPRGALVLRVAADASTTLRVRVGTHNVKVDLPPTSWHEALVELPSELAAGRRPVTIQSEGGRFTSLHYFSLARRE
ncbi:MAG: hypothetical protein ACOY0T_29725 [Myxococcota bacterium]